VETFEYSLISCIGLKNNKYKNCATPSKFKINKLNKSKLNTNLIKNTYTQKVKHDNCTLLQFYIVSGQSGTKKEISII